MNKSDIEFTVGLNTSPAEQQLNELGNKVRANSHIYNDIFKDVGQGFKMVGSPYQNSNNYGVPSTQVLERSVAVLSNVMERFARIVETMSAQMVNFTTVGRAYSPQSAPINMGSKVAGYLPHYYPSALSESYNSRPLGLPSPDYAINANDIFDAIIRRRKAQEASYSPIYSMASEQFARTMNPYGMYETWKNNFAFNMLGLPAPQDNVARETYIGAGGRKYSKRKREKSIDAVSEELESFADEDKKDNIELEEKVVKWGKIFGLVYGIRKLIQGMTKLWKFGADTATSRNRNINEELGYFSIDPEGAMRANVDKTRSMIYAGIRNWGENSPVSKEGFDYTARKFTEMWTSAMSGRQVDTQTAIDAQRLKDFFGLDLTVAGLLTGQREGKTATDIQLDAMKKVEQQLSKLDTVDSTTKGQIIDSLKNIFGEEMINAIVTNFNKNLKLDTPELKQTLAERFFSVGGDAVPGKDLTEKTTLATTALSKFAESISELKNTFVEQFADIFVDATNALSNFMNWVNRKLNKGENELNEIGETKNPLTISAATTGTSWYEHLSGGGNNYYFPTTQKLEDESDVFKDKKQRAKDYLKGKTANEIFAGILLSNADINDASDIENLAIGYNEKTVGEALYKNDLSGENDIVKEIVSRYGNRKGLLEAYKKFTPLIARSSNVIKLLSGEEMSMEERLKAYRDFAKSEFGARLFMNSFKAGGVYDYNTALNPFTYLFTPSFFSNNEEQLEAIKTFVKDIETQGWGDNRIQNADVVSDWKDRNNNGRIDAGEVELTLVVKEEGTGKVLERKPITFDIN